MKNTSQIGKCHICGTIAKLSYEHIPPQKAFNGRNVKMFNGADFRKVVESKYSYWEYPKLDLKYSQKQSGAGWYTLCESCNNNTGSWYGDSLVRFIYEGYINIKLLGGERNLHHMNKYNFIFKQIYPLRIIKEAFAMFCSINPPEFADKFPDIKNFILNRDSNELDITKYAVYLYIIQGTIARYVGDAKMGQRQKDGSMIIKELSECNAPPYGMLLEIDPKPFAFPTVNIIDFAKYNYDDKVDLQIEIPVYECNSMLPADFRTKEEIEETGKINRANNTPGIIAFKKN
ncbi:MAG TPA: hypothetical protein VNW29_01100 [Candidatus Sulfotelmatobacter sp.]|jgi:hypothetical protein|nr:hypothetical protein [Candidatus Sulfotelmatobacter sp.]